MGDSVIKTIRRLGLGTALVLALVVGRTTSAGILAPPHYTGWKVERPTSAEFSRCGSSVYVASHPLFEDDCVHQFSPNGELLSTWPVGVEPELGMSVAVGPNGDVFVSWGNEGIGAVDVFSFDGTFVRRISAPIGPRAIAAAQDGTLLVASFHQGLHHQDAFGNTIQMWDSSKFGPADVAVDSRGYAYGTIQRGLCDTTSSQG